MKLKNNVLQSFRISKEVVKDGNVKVHGSILQERSQRMIN